MDHSRIYGDRLLPNQIRLLELSPLNSVADSPIHGSLKIHELKKDSFVAISYVWGNASDLVPIHLNNAWIEVTRNAHSVLTLLARASFPSSSRDFQHLDAFANKKIWLDAISINQQDIPEKEDQVRLMRDIYKSAESTVLWIGSPDIKDSRSPLAIGWLHRLVDSMPYNQFVVGREVRAHLWDEEAYSGLRCMMHQPWFHRRWIVQEAAVSQHPLLL